MRALATASCWRHPRRSRSCAVRYGDDFAAETQAAPYGSTIHRDAVDITLVPAGHVLGSAQAVVC